MSVFAYPNTALAFTLKYIHKLTYAQKEEKKSRILIKSQIKENPK